MSKATDSNSNGHPQDHFDPEDFVKTWEIITGDVGHDPGSSDDFYAIITKPAGGNVYRLYSQKNDQDLRFRQELTFNKRTRTLEGTTKDGLHRAISFWDGDITGRKDRIFAMRTRELGVPLDSPARCDWENFAETDGAWGGEDG